MVYTGRFGQSEDYRRDELIRIRNTSYKLLIIRPSSCSFSYYCCYQFPCPTIIAELTKVDSLPRPHIYASVGDGNGNAHTAKGRFCMCWHIIGTFQNMLIVGLILWDKTVEDGFHVNPHVRITVFVDAQSATRMLREDIDDTSLR